MAALLEPPQGRILEAIFRPIGLNTKAHGGPRCLQLTICLWRLSSIRTETYALDKLCLKENLTTIWRRSYNPDSFVKKLFDFT